MLMSDMVVGAGAGVEFIRCHDRLGAEDQAAATSPPSSLLSASGDRLFAADVGEMWYGSMTVANFWFDDSIEERKAAKRNETRKREVNDPLVRSCWGGTLW